MSALLLASMPPVLAPATPAPNEHRLLALLSLQQLIVSRCRAVQSKFRGSSATLLAVADCRSFATGIENCRFEGPVRLCIPCPPSLGAVDAEGGFSFELPLPNPEQNVGAPAPFPLHCETG